MAKLKQQRCPASVKVKNKGKLINVPCNNLIEIEGETKIGEFKMIRLKCGHAFVEKDLFHDGTDALKDYVPSDLSESYEVNRFDSDGGDQLVNFISPSYFSLDKSMVAYEFQREGVEFAEKTNQCCLIADEMGLGKTIQALLLIKRKPEVTLICCKGSITLQWAHQFKKWASYHPLEIMPIMHRDHIIPGFNVYIISIDFLSRKGVLDKLKNLNIKRIIVDECQNFKDSNSNRTKALINLIQDNKIEHRIFLSGTPIKNRANEYFVILNLLDPNRFHSYINFCRTWLIPNEKGVYTRLDPSMIDRFHDVTSRYIIRREVKDVQKNLPKLTRDFQWIKIEDPTVKNSYNNELEQFENFLNTAERVDTTSLLGWLAKMRAITGQAKVPWAIEYASQFLDQTDKSLLIGIHHHSVRDQLYYKMGQEGYNPVKFSGEDNLWAKERAKQAFISGENRLMIMNMIAGGTGTDGLQKACHNVLTLERAWSSADEEQFEKRVSRDGQDYPVNCVYPIAEGTIDEWFHELVANKREIVRETMGDAEADSYDPMSDSGLIKELAEKTVRHRL